MAMPQHRIAVDCLRQRGAFEDDRCKSLLLEHQKNFTADAVNCGVSQLFFQIGRSQVSEGFFIDPEAMGFYGIEQQRSELLDGPVSEKGLAGPISLVAPLSPCISG
jgi:hypothetical protein